jgi:hypothetical protein
MKPITLLAYLDKGDIQLPTPLMSRVYVLEGVVVPAIGDLQPPLGPGGKTLGSLGEPSRSRLTGSRSRLTSSQGNLTGGQRVNSGGTRARGAWGPRGSRAGGMRATREI